MDLFRGLLAGLALAVGDLSAVGWLLAGTVIGLWVGVIPGLSAAVILSVVLVFVYHLSLQATLVFFLAIHAAGFFSASLTAILLNTPAHAEAVPVAFDGYPMAARGQGARALGISATATAFGAVLGFAILVSLFQVVNEITLLFTPAEYVALIVLALALVGTLGVRRMSKAAISMALGFLVSAIGHSAVTGANRFTFGSPLLLQGIPLAVVSIGVFAIPQMVMVFGTATSVARQDMTGKELADAAPVDLGPRAYREVLGGMRDAIRHWRLLIQSCLIGTVCGIVPGVGGFAANYLSYTAAHQLSRGRGHLYGTGIPEGIAAAEAASIPKEHGGLFTIFGLGLPHGTSSALFLVALAIKGLQPGIGFLNEHADVVYGSHWIVLISGVLGTIGGLLSAPVLVRLTRIPGPVLLPFVVAFSLVGMYVGYRSYLPIGEAMLFALVGLAMRRLGYSLASIVVGLVMGSILEQNLFLAGQLYPDLGFLLQHPGAIVIGLVAVAVLGAAFIRMRRVPKAEGLRRYPLLELVTSITVAVVCGAMGIYAALTYNLATSIIPDIAAALAAVAAVWQVPGDLAAYREARRAAASASRTVTAGIVERSWGRNGQYSRELVALVWVAGAMLLCFVFGFHIGVPVFVLLYGLTAVRRALPKRTPRVIFAVASAAAFLVVVVALFGTLAVIETPLIGVDLN